MRLFKRALSAFMALNMMLTLLPFNIANATESNANDSYTVTLQNVENGVVSFTDESKETSTARQTNYQIVTVNDKGELIPIENDGSVWAFSVGDMVEIVLTPNEGYGVKSFVIKNSNNDILATKETTDNVFSFAMVNENLIIESNFEKIDSTSTQTSNPIEGNLPIENNGFVIPTPTNPTNDDENNGGIMPIAGDDGDVTLSGPVAGDWWAEDSYLNHPAHNANVFAGRSEDGQDLTVYCGQSKVPAYRQWPNTVHFEDPVEVTDEQIRKLLFYTNPLWAQGMTITEFSIADESNDHFNYFMVHYALTAIYSPGDATSQMRNFRSSWERLIQIINTLPPVTASGVPGAEDFHVYKIPYANRQDMFFAMKPPRKPKPPKDPLKLTLGKLGNKTAPTMSEATLEGAIIHMVIYNEEQFASEGKDLPTTIAECRAARPGTTELVFATKLGTNKNGETVGFIDFAPPFGKDVSEYLTSHDQDEAYRTWFGTPGVYWIFEEQAPKGYLTSGTMEVTGADNKTNDVITTGVMIKISLAENWEDYWDEDNEKWIGDPWIREVNGKVVEQGEVETENELDEYHVKLYENEGTPLLETWAEWQDTNTQWTNPSDDLKAIDHIHVYNIMANNHVEVKTYLFFLDEIEGLDEETLQDPEKIIAAGAHVITCKCGRSSVVSNVAEGEYACNGDHHSLKWLSTREWQDHDFETEFEIDTSQAGQTPDDFRGRDLIFMNYVYMKEMHENGEVPANWTLVTDASEMLHFPKGATVCIGDYTGKHIVHAWTGQDVREMIHIENLRPNTRYRVDAWLMDKDTNDIARDAYGTPIKNTQNTWYQWSDPNGIADWIVDFKFDAHFYEQHLREGREYVAYVDVYEGNELVWSHQLFDDEEESFYIPHITTELLDSKTKVHVSYAEGPQVTLIDTIRYDHMLPGEEYMIVGKLIDMDTGDIAVDANGNQIIRYKIVHTDGTEGEWTMEYTFDASNLEGHVLVCYEEVYVRSNGSEQNYFDGTGPWAEVAHHTDYWDRAQRMYFPYIDTYANDVKTGGFIRGATNADANHNAFAEDEMSIQDLVRYEAVEPVIYYTLLSKLVYALDTPDGLHKKGEVVVDDNGKEQTMLTGIAYSMYR